jgi:dTDP-4-dehydrorhamnose reductase
MVARIKSKLKWLIVGGEGQFGKSLATDLALSGVEYVSLSHKQLDITDLNQVGDRFSIENPDVVVNAAAWTNVDQAEISEEQARSVNALGAQILAQQARQHDIRLIQLSTDYVFSGKSGSPWSEKSETFPLSAYGRTKAEGEQLVLHEWGKKSIIIRTAWLYSPWGKNFVRTVLDKALNYSGNIEVIDDQIGQPTSASDLASRVQTLVNRDIASGIYHGTNSGSASWFEFAQQIFKSCGEDSARVKRISSSNKNQIAPRPRYSVLAHDSWAQVELEPMRDWRQALNAALPTILENLERKGADNGD